MAIIRWICAGLVIFSIFPVNAQQSLERTYRVATNFRKAGELKKAIYFYGRLTRSKNRYYFRSSYYRALLYKKLGNSNAAVSILENLIFDEKTPQKILVRAEALYDQLERAGATDFDYKEFSYQRKQLFTRTKKQPSKWSAYLQAGLSFNSNPLLVSDLPQDSETGLQTSTTDQSDLALMAKLRLGYKFLKTNALTGFANYSFSVDQYNETEDANFQAHDISLPLTWYTKSVKYRLSGLYSQQVKEQGNFLKNAGYEVDVTKRFSSVDISLFYLSTTLTPQDESFAYLDGTSTSYGIGLFRSFSFGNVNLSGSYSESDLTDSEEITASNAGYLFFAGFSIPSTTTTWSFSVGYFAKEYVPNLSDGSVREDEVMSLKISPSYRVSRQGSLFWDNKYTKNSSNDDERSYKQFVSMIGFRWYPM